MLKGEKLTEANVSFVCHGKWSDHNLSRILHPMALTSSQNKATLGNQKHFCKHKHAKIPIVNKGNKSHLLRTDHLTQGFKTKYVNSDEKTADIGFTHGRHTQIPKSSSVGPSDQVITREWFWRFFLGAKQISHFFSHRPRIVGMSFWHVSELNETLWTSCVELWCQKRSSTRTSFSKDQ